MIAPIEQVGHGPLFGTARAYLWVVAAFMLLVCFVMGLACAAGPARPGQSPWRTVGVVAVVLLAAHTGYLLAPLWIGTSRGVWAMWLMMPLAALALVALASMLRWLPLGAREGVDAGRAWLAALPKMTIVLGVYVAPAVLMWIYRVRG